MCVVHCTACPLCMQIGAATSAVFYALHAVVRLCIICILHVVDSMNANANHALVPQCRNSSVVVNFAGCEEALLDLVHYYILPWDCSTVALCILHFAGRFPHTVGSTLSVPGLSTFSYFRTDHHESS